MISVLVPVRERPGDLDELYRSVSAAFTAAKVEAEFIFASVPECSGNLASVRSRIREGAPITTLVTTHDVDDATLLRLAARDARADTLLVVPAYPRITPEALPRLVAAVADGVDLVAARRFPRRDAWTNRLQQWLFHALLPQRRLRLNDLGCGVLVMRRDVLDRVPVYGDMVRFLPLLAEREGLVVKEMDAPQDPRDLGTRVYGPGTYARRVLDLADVFFLLRFTDKPLRFFGLVGSVLGGAGAVILAVLFAERMQGVGIANRPLLLLGLLLLVVGIQVAALGLVAEIIVFLHAATRPTYRVVPPR